MENEKIDQVGSEARKSKTKEGTKKRVREEVTRGKEKMIYQ